MHGKTSTIEHDGAACSRACRSRFEVGRYHSLIAQPESLPPICS
jgi:anthranilate/para-aminobenzoate synthase component II